MPLTARLDASFGADGFELDVSFTDLTDVLGTVSLPTLSFRGDLGDLDVSSLDLDDIVATLSDVVSRLGGVVDALPDLDAVLGPLRAAMSLLDIVADGGIPELVTSFETAIGPNGTGLPALLDAAGRLGEMPAISSVVDLVAPLGLDLRAPGALVGGPAGGLVSLVQLVGALLGVDTASREIAGRAQLAVGLLSADRIAGLVAMIGNGRSRQLADLLVGIDPNDPTLVDIISAPIEAHLADVRELLDLLVRGMAYTEATLVDADLPELVAALDLASIALSSSALAPVDALVATMQGYARPLLGVQVPELGADAVWGATATLASQMEAAIAGVEPSALRQIVDPILDPVLGPLRTVQLALDELAAVLATVLDPVSDAIDAVDLSVVTDAIETLVGPLQDVVDTVVDLIGGATAEVQGVVGTIDDLLDPVRDALNEAAGVVTAPFVAVSTVLDDLDLDALMARISDTLSSVADALGSVPVRPVFDVASDVIGTTADALGLVPKALLPDDLKAALEAACAPVEALDLEPVRVELHDRLDSIIDSLDASVLDAVRAGYTAVKDFVASIDPHPFLDELETQAFAALVDGLDQLDPTVLLAPIGEALDGVRGALETVDLRALLKPVDTALDTVVAALAQVNPEILLEPVADLLDGVREQVDATLQLSTWADRLDAAEAALVGMVERFDPAPLFVAMRGGWSDLIGSMRPDSTGSGLLAGLAGALVGPMPYSVNPGGIAEVLGWIRGQRDGSAVVRDRLTAATASLSSAKATMDALDVRSITAELDVGQRALVAALAAHPDDSLLVSRLAPGLAASSPTASLALVLGNIGRVTALISSSAATVAATTAPDRSEVALVASGLDASFGPLAPVAAKVRELLLAAGADPDQHDARAALLDTLESAGADAVIGPVEAIATSIFTRVVELVRDGIFAPLHEGVDEFNGLLDALALDTLTAGVAALHAELLAKVAGLRPATVLAAPLTLFDAIRDTLDAFDPLAPVQAAIDELRALIGGFVEEFKPTVVLAPVLSAHDQLSSLIGSFDLGGLLDPIFTALHSIGADIDSGMREVIDALERLKNACESGGGPIPGLDLSIAVSVDVPGGFGL